MRILEPGLRKSVTLLREFAAMPEDIRAEKRIAIEFDFFAQPKALDGRGQGRGGRSRAHRSRERARDGHRRDVHASRPTSWSAASAIAPRRSPACRSTSAPAASPTTRGASCPGSIASAGPGAARRARSAPTGPTASRSSSKIAEDIADGTLGQADKAGREGFDALAAERGLDVVTFRDWKKIEEAEEKAAREGAPREKFVDIEAMIRAGKLAAARPVAEPTPASASARRAPGSCRPGGSASARPASARCSSTVSPSIWLRMSLR